MLRESPDRQLGSGVSVDQLDRGGDDLGLGVSGLDAALTHPSIVGGGSTGSASLPLTPGRDQLGVLTRSAAVRRDLIRAGFDEAFQVAHALIDRPDRAAVEDPL